MARTQREQSAARRRKAPTVAAGQSTGRVPDLSWAAQAPTAIRVRCSPYERWSQASTAIDRGVALSRSRFVARSGRCTPMETICQGSSDERSRDVLLSDIGPGACGSAALPRTALGREPAVTNNSDPC